MSAGARLAMAMHRAASSMAKPVLPSAPVHIPSLPIAPCQEGSAGNGGCGCFQGLWVLGLD